MEVDLRRHLDVGIMLPYLKRHELLNTDQQDQLAMVSQTRSDQIKKLLEFLKQNCTCPATRLREVLQEIQLEETGVPALEDITADLTRKLVQMRRDQNLRGQYYYTASLHFYTCY